MNIAFHTASTGLKAYQNKLDVTANNIANVNTTGYKNKETSFQDLIYSNMNTKVEGNHKVGHGSRVGDVNTIFEQGVLQSTGRELDFAIVGRAFFAVQGENGNVSYTRDGAFQIGLEQTGAYLLNANGAYVLDGAGNRIQIPYEAGTNTPDMTAILGRIGLFTFENPEGLLDLGNNVYQATNESGAAIRTIQSAENRLQNGMLEASSVDTGTEMVHMIEAQRAFQMSARMVTSADEVEEVVNNLR